MVWKPIHLVLEVLRVNKQSSFSHLFLLPENSELPLLVEKGKGTCGRRTPRKTDSDRSQASPQRPLFQGLLATQCHNDLHHFLLHNHHHFSPPPSPPFFSSHEIYFPGLNLEAYNRMSYPTLHELHSIKILGKNLGTVSMKLMNFTKAGFHHCFRHSSLCS